MRHLILLLLIITSSCAQLNQSKKKGIVSEVKNGNISISAVLNLGKSAYLKGCIDSKNFFIKDKAVIGFDKCKELANIYGDELEQIISQ